MQKVEEIKIKISSIYIFSKEDISMLIDSIQNYDDKQLVFLDKKLDIILKKLGVLTLKLINKSNNNKTISHNLGI